MAKAYVTIVNRHFYAWLHLLCTLFPSQHDIVVMIPDSEPTPVVNTSRIRLLRRPMIEPYARSGRYSGAFTGFMKLHLWMMTEYDAVLYHDIDLLLRRPIDELLAWSVPFAAARDDGLVVQTSTHKFNTGLMLLRPSAQMHTLLLRAYRARIPSYDNTDQGFLQTFFRHRNVTRIPNEYNTLRRRMRFVDVTDVIGFHFVGENKLAMYPAFERRFSEHAAQCRVATARP